MAFLMIGFSWHRGHCGKQHDKRLAPQTVVAILSMFEPKGCWHYRRVPAGVGAVAGRFGWTGPPYPACLGSLLCPYGYLMSDFSGLLGIFFFNILGLPFVSLSSK